MKTCENIIKMNINFLKTKNGALSVYKFYINYQLDEQFSQENSKRQHK